MRPPSRFTLVSREQGGAFVNRYTLTAADDGTRVDRTMEMPKPSDLAGVIFPVFLATFIKPKVGRGMDMFRDNLETSTG